MMDGVLGGNGKQFVLVKILGGYFITLFYNIYWGGGEEGMLPQYYQRSV